MAVSSSKEAKVRSREMRDNRSSSGSDASVGVGLPPAGGGAATVGRGAVSGVGGTRVAVKVRGVAVGGSGVAVGSTVWQPVTNNDRSITSVIALFRTDISPPPFRQL
jgi:hypothetical protein